MANRAGSIRGVPMGIGDLGGVETVTVPDVLVVVVSRTARLCGTWLYGVAAESALPFLGRQDAAHWAAFMCREERFRMGMLAESADSTDDGNARDQSPRGYQFADLVIG